LCVRLQSASSRARRSVDRSWRAEQCRLMGQRRALRVWGSAAACDSRALGADAAAAAREAQSPSDSAIELLDTRAMARAICREYAALAGRAGHERPGFTADSSSGGMAAARRGCASDGPDPNESAARCRAKPG